MKTKIQAVIFDMDGVLIDSEPLFDQHMEKYLPTLGITVEKAYYEQFRGVTIKYQWTTIKNDFSLDYSLEYLMQTARTSYFNFLLSSKLHAVPGVKSLINSLQKKNFRLALASSASLQRIKLFLEKLSLLDIFEVIICGDDVKKSKPAPDIYLKAAGRLGVQPLNCVVIEDATNGILAAKAASMKVIGFAGSHHNHQDLSAADLIITDFKQISPSFIRQL